MRLTPDKRADGGRVSDIERMRECCLISFNDQGLSSSMSVAIHARTPDQANALARPMPAPAVINMRFE
jgi:hypothetical protein